MTDEIRSQDSFFVHPNALVESGQIGPRTRVWAFAHVMRGAVVGADCNIGDHAFIESGARLGNNVTVKNGVSVWSLVTVEDDCFLGPHCVFTNDPNPRSFVKKGSDSLEPTLIRRGATIGANATIVCDRTVGEYAFIGAGAVVIRDVPDYGLVVGNPARLIGWMCACGIRLALTTAAAEGEGCACAGCGASYVRVGNGLRKL